MIRYTITMGIRTVCVLAMVFVRGWWLVIPAAGAIFLPYIAVVLANVKRNPARPAVLRPGAVERRPDDSGDNL